MDSRTKDITNQKFGKLTAIKYIGKKEWECLCECGKTTIVRGALLRNGHTKSCGCFTGGIGVARSHGATVSGKQTPEYTSWIGMKRRCLNESDYDYKDYGARGITVCDRWINSYETFLTDMGKCPAKHTLDRIDNSKGYSPENCRWASRKEQANNRRIKKNSPLYTFDGISQDLGAWAKDPRCIVKYVTLYHRVVYMNVPLYEAMTKQRVKRI